MPRPNYQNRRDRRRGDRVKVKIEDVNLSSSVGPLAQGRDKDHGLYDIDLTQGVGSRFPDPQVGETWWIERSGRVWVLLRKVDPDREGGDDSDTRQGVPENVEMLFFVREKKTHLTYRGAVTFDPVIVDENGDPQITEYYVVQWVPCSKEGNIIAQERVRQMSWNPNDADIDEEDDPAADYQADLPGNIERPKKWHYKARVRAVAEGGDKKGPWSDWTDPLLPFKNAHPEPPYPQKIDLRFRWKDSDHKPVFSAVTRFNDVNFWDIPGFDYEDDIDSYYSQLQPLQRVTEWEVDHTYQKGRAVVYSAVVYQAKDDHKSKASNAPPGNKWVAVDEENIVLTPLDLPAPDEAPFDGLYYGGDGEHYFIKADPQVDGDPWEVRRKHVKDKDTGTKKDRDDPKDEDKGKRETDDKENWVALGTLTADVSSTDVTFEVDETGVVGIPEADGLDQSFVVLTADGEQWLVTNKTLVSGSIYEYELYRQFRDTDAQSHVAGTTLEWLKDPYHYKVDWHRVERPHSIWWRTRVRSKDRFNRRGPWSPWTIPELPWLSIDWNVPPPAHLRAHIEIAEHKTHIEYKLTASFKDPAPDGWNVPGGDPEDDLDRYVIQARAVLPDPDGYIEAPPPEWNATVEYAYNDVVAYKEAYFRSLISENSNNNPVDEPTAWDPTTDLATFRIPDRRIGVLVAPDGLFPAQTVMTIQLDDDLPPSIMTELTDIDKKHHNLRILTPVAEEEGAGTSEVVATIPPDDDPDKDVVEWDTTASYGINQYVSFGGVIYVAIQETDDTIAAPNVATDYWVTYDNEGDIRTYVIERGQLGSGDWGHNDGDVVFLLTEHLRRRTVHDKDKDDPGKFHRWYHVDMGRLHHPDRYYWQVRGRSIDGFNHRGAWTDWGPPISPGTDPDLIIPFPEDVFITFDKVHRHRHRKYRCIVHWNEVAYNTPDGDHEKDVTRYGVQLATSDGDNLFAAIDDSVLSFVVEERRRGAPDDLPFFILVDDEIMKVTNRVVVDADARTYTYTVERADRETLAEEHLINARVYNLPFMHHTQSAKTDKDKNKYTRSVFTGIHKWYYYKARVRVFDRYNRHSEWSPWTDPGTPSDTEAPPPPEDVDADIDLHKIIIQWDAPTNPNDDDATLPELDIDVSYFQIQMSKTDNGGTRWDPANIVKQDRMHKSTTKTWRIKKPKANNKANFDTYYVRVRSSDASGNRSVWVETNCNVNGVPTPDAPVIEFDTNERTKKIRANVTLEEGVLGDDDDIDGYEFQLQPAEFKRLAAAINAGAVSLTVNNNSNTPSTNFDAYIQKEQILVTNKAGTTWTITRAQNSTTAKSHRRRARVQFFQQGTKKRRKKTGEETEVGDPILAIYHNIQRGMWYRARVRAHNDAGLWGNWSDWGH